MTSKSSRVERSVIFAATSCLLQYPDEGLVDQLPALAGASEVLPAGARKPLGKLIAHLGSRTLLELQGEYVETFDLRRRNCLYLTYREDGDTRRRGEALWLFADLYRRRGYTIADGELADFLPVLLELAAQAAPDDSEPLDLLIAHQPGVTLLRHSLEEDGSPYADAIRALEFVLPRPDPAVAAAAMQMKEMGPPFEEVGLDRFCAIEPERVHP